MSDGFSASAKQLAPVAAQILGWRPDEFWQSTPEELALSLSDPNAGEAGQTLTRDDLQNMLEREKNG